MESGPSSRQRTARVLGVLIIALLLWLLLRPTVNSSIDLDQRRAQLEEAIRQRDEAPSPSPPPRTMSEPVPAELVIPPAPPEPPPLKQQPPAPPDAYMESVLRYLRNIELRQYDELARRKENFDQKLQTESDRIARQKEMAENAQAPPPKIVLSSEVKSRLNYCLRCHARRDPVELAEMFAKAGDFH